MDDDPCSASRPPALLFPSDSPLRLERNDSRGRYLVACEDIKEGQVVLRGEPYAAALMSSHRKRVCRRCLTVAASGHHMLSCRGCAQVFWCSEACRDQHTLCEPSGQNAPLTLSVPHGKVCQCLKALSSSKFDVEMESVLAMLAESVANLAAQAGAEDTASRAETGSKCSERKLDRRISHADFLSLEGHLEEMLERDTKDKQQWRKGARVLMHHIEAMDGGRQAIERFQISETVLLLWASMILCNNFALNYDKVESPEPADDSPAEHPSRLMMTVPDGTPLSPPPASDTASSGNAQALEPLHLRMSSTCSPGWVEARDDSNTAASTSELVEGMLCCGRIVYPGMSYFNHSCSPNCAVLRGLHSAEARAISDISVGEEICISYIDTDLPRSERQKILKRNFHFTCMCPRCEYEAMHGSKKYTFLKSASTKSTKPKPRGRKARISR